MRQQFPDSARFVGGQADEDIFQVGMGIMPVHAGRLDQAHHGSRTLAGA